VIALDVDRHGTVIGNARVFARHPNPDLELFPTGFEQVIQRRTDVEVEAMAMAPIPTPEVLWRKPPVLALAALPGTALGRLGEPSTASSAAWAAAGAAARMLHDAPLPPWPGRSLEELASRLDGECEWLVANDVLPADVVTRNRQLAETALRPRRTSSAYGSHPGLRPDSSMRLSVTDSSTGCWRR
jgi:hypothetical protein